MIRSKYNRYIFLLTLIVLVAGTIRAFEEGPALAIAFFLIVATFQFLIRCPKCGNLACRMTKPKGYAPPMPRKCFNCDFRYK